jgi:hypothetical protein
MEIQIAKGRSGWGEWLVGCGFACRALSSTPSSSYAYFASNITPSKLPSRFIIYVEACLMHVPYELWYRVS